MEMPSSLVEIFLKHIATNEPITEEELIEAYSNKHPELKPEKLQLNYVKGDLFSCPRGYYFAHCISDDFTLGAGIAKKFDELYNMRYKLWEQYGGMDLVGCAVLVDEVFNLITKEFWYNKPTYESLKSALIDCRDMCEDLSITKLAMPKIGCGLDKLEWDKVEKIIHEVFGDMNIQIDIYVLE